MIDIFLKHYKTVIAELKKTYDLFTNNEKYLAKGIDVPYGVIIYGNSGRGKTTLLKLIAMHSPIPSYFYGGGDDLFERLKEAGQGKCIFVLDDADKLDKETFKKLNKYLLSKDPSLHNIFFVMSESSNSDFDLDVFYTRPVLVSIGLTPDSIKDKYEMFMDLVKSLNINVKEELTTKYLYPELSTMEIGDMKHTLDLVVMNYGFDDISESQVLDAMNEANIYYHSCHNEFNNKYFAVYAAGKALISKRFKYLDVVSLTLTFGSACCETINQKEDDPETEEVLLDDIKVLIAGNLATKLIYNTGDKEAELDIGCAASQVYYLINNIGYKGVCLASTGLKVSEEKRLMIDRMSKQILEDLTNDVNSYLIKHKKQLIALADALYDKKNLNGKEIDEILNIHN